MLNKTNVNIAIVSSIGTGLCTTLFAFSMFTKQDMFSYFVCLILSLFYLTMVVYFINKILHFAKPGSIIQLSTN